MFNHLPAQLPGPLHQQLAPASQLFAAVGLVAIGHASDLQVADAASALADFQGRGGVAELPLTDEAFGQRRFGFRDPSGLWVDVVEQIEPQAGFWDRYRV